MIRTERKYIEILRILKDHSEPVGAKRLSEIMAERGFILTDRAVQYYLQYLDEMGFTEKVGNMGRILTDAGISETDCALVGDRIGFVISKLERLAYRTTFDPESGTGDVAYNLSMVPKDQEEQICSVFDEIIKAECGFFNSYKGTRQRPEGPAGLDRGHNPVQHQHGRGIPEEWNSGPDGIWGKAPDRKRHSRNVPRFNRLSRDHYRPASVIYICGAYFCQDPCPDKIRDRPCERA